jgi:hypothetical protein
MNKIDQKIITLSVLISLAGLFFFFKKEGESDTRISNKPVIGFFLEKTNTVKSNKNDDIKWEHANVGSKVHDRDQIFTYNGSSAKIKLDGEESVVNIVPNTMIRIQKSDKDTVLSVKRGQFIFNTQNKKSKLRIKIKDEVIDIDANKRATILITDDSIQLLKGSGEIKKENKNIKLSEETPIEFFTDKDIQEEIIDLPTLKEDISFSLIYPQDKALVQLYNPNESTSFSFNVSNAKDNASIFLEISKEKTFKKSRKVKVTSNFLKLKLSPSVYYWRLSDGDIKSNISTVTIAKSQPLKLTELPNIELSYIATKNDTRERYLISWPADEDAQKYRIQIYRDFTLTKVVLERESLSNNVLWFNKIYDEYFYRVSIIDKWGQTGPATTPKKLIAPISPLTE